MSTCAQQSEDAFITFLAARGSTKWMIATDWCIRDDTRHNDAFAFTIFPYDAEFAAIQADINKTLPKDIKNVKVVDGDMARLLKSDRRFTFCFIPRRDRRLFADLATAQKGMDYTIGMMKAWIDADKHTTIIREMEALRQEMQAKNFNIKLLEDIVLTAVFVGFIASLIAKHSKPEIIGWFPDRDKITQAYRSIANTLSSINFSAFCQQHDITHANAQIVIGIPDATDTTNGLWFDPLIRIPDYIAGAVAAYDLETNQVDGKNPKFLQIIEEVIADTYTIKLIRLVCNDTELYASRIGISKTKQPE